MTIGRYQPHACAPGLPPRVRSPGTANRVVRATLGGSPPSRRPQDRRRGKDHTSDSRPGRRDPEPRPRRHSPDRDPRPRFRAARSHASRLPDTRGSCPKAVPQGRDPRPCPKAVPQGRAPRPRPKAMPQGCAPRPCPQVVPRDRTPRHLRAAPRATPRTCWLRPRAAIPGHDPRARELSDPEDSASGPRLRRPRPPPSDPRRVRIVTQVVALGAATRGRPGCDPRPPSGAEPEVASRVTAAGVRSSGPWPSRSARPGPRTRSGAVDPSGLGAVDRSGASVPSATPAPGRGWPREARAQEAS